eukprot:Nk52_evm5s229 gene=Nk52_evmTU5s229
MSGKEGKEGMGRTSRVAVLKALMDVHLPELKALCIRRCGRLLAIAQSDLANSNFFVLVKEHVEALEFVKNGIVTACGELLRGGDVSLSDNQYTLHEHLAAVIDFTVDCCLEQKLCLLDVQCDTPPLVLQAYISYWKVFKVPDYAVELKKFYGK